MDRHLVIAGAGIGGLTCALLAARAGFDVTLVERRTSFHETGAGIQLSPNASHILIKAGLGPALSRQAVAPQKVTIREAGRGHVLETIPLGETATTRYGAPYWVIERAHLHTVLLDAVRSCSNIRLLVGRNCVHAQTLQNEVHIALEKDGSGTQDILKADVFVGADGIGSQSRMFIKDDRLPEFRQAIAWRTTLPTAQLDAAYHIPETTLWLGRGLHVVHYPIAAGQKLNIVVVTQSQRPIEGWSAPGNMSELLSLVSKEAPALKHLLTCVKEWTCWSLFDLPVRTMAQGHLALLGDAAHPILPYLAQGGALAIEDAASLIRHLQSGKTVEKALQSYAKERIARASHVQKAARRNGWAYHLSGPMAFARNLALKHGRVASLKSYDWLYGWK